MTEDRERALLEEIQNLKDDRDSWIEQASARTADAVKYAEEVERLKAALQGWIQANGPGGWIDDLRQAVALSGEVKQLREALGDALHRLEMHADKPGYWKDDHRVVSMELVRRAIDSALSGAAVDRAVAASVAPQWLPIESAPKDGTRFLVYGVPIGEINDRLTEGPVVGVAEWSYGRLDCPDTDCYSVSWNDVALWTPLPQAPSAQEESRQQNLGEGA